MADFSTVKLECAWCAGKTNSCNPWFFRTAKLLKFMFWANKKHDPMLWSTWLPQNWHVPKNWISAKLLNRKFKSKYEIIQPLTYPVNYQKNCTIDFFFKFMKVHYFMPYVIIAYPVLALPKTMSACMVCTIELKFLGQKWIRRKVSNKGCNNNGLH